LRRKEGLSFYTAGFYKDKRINGDFESSEESNSVSP
jgi:hypothetical protein